MKPFTSVAIPHRDILERRLTMDIFAADLWEVFKGRAHGEYQDPKDFFRKTYITEGLNRLLSIAEKRLKGEGGDPIIQLQTPFGGGKTHSLIALYHKGHEWNTNVVVIDGSSLDPKDAVLWEEIEKQLTGKIQILQGKTSPGREKLRTLLADYQPLFILMDEVHAYTVKASGIKIEDSTLANQTLTFMQELTGTIRTLDTSLLMVTLPSSSLEHYDEHEDKLFQQLQKIFGRVEKIYTPVQEYEISSIVRNRLFSNINDEEAQSIIEEFLDYAEKEGFLPEDTDRSIYREKFMKSYPFQPEVIDILYKRWGSFTTFQRTRAVLRLLSLVIYSLKDSKTPFIRLSDFNLGNEEIERELLTHIGQEFDSVIAADISSSNSGAKKVDKKLGDIHTSFSFGTRAATTIFMYSHCIGFERGVTLDEIKLSSAEISFPSSVVAEAVSKLRENLFYLQSNGRFYFTSQPNLNRIKLTKKDSVTDEIVTEEERNYLGNNIKKEHFEIYLWPKNSKEISDAKRLKLLVLRNRDEELAKELLENSGTLPRVNRNSLIFLCPRDSERPLLEDSIKEKCAWEFIEKDKTLNLTDEQEKIAKGETQKMKGEVSEGIRRLYRIVLLPSKDGFEEVDLGHPTYGAEASIDKRVYEILKSEDKIMERLSPLIIQKRYLKELDYVKTKNIYDTFFSTPGEIRIISDEILKECIKNGVNEGLFGIGDLENELPICRHYKEGYVPELVEEEILINAKLCQKEGLSAEDLQEILERIAQVKTEEELNKIKEEIPWNTLIDDQKEIIKEELKKKRDQLIYVPGQKPGSQPPHVKKYHGIKLKLNVPSGKLSDIVWMVNYIKQKFEQVDVQIDIETREGEITASDYEDKIKEAIQQANVIVEEEEMN